MIYLKTLFRSIQNSRLYTVINIAGLAVSLGCVILITGYVHQETTVNHFAEDLDHTYLMVIEDRKGESRYSWVIDGQSEILNDPLINIRSTFLAFEEDNIVLDDNMINIKSLAVDSNFMKILPYPVLYGRNKMSTPDDVIISRKLSETLFGSINPIGKSITYSSGDELKVVGVLDNPKTKSSLEFDILLNKDQRQFRVMMGYDLIMVYPGSDVKQLNDKYSEYIQRRQISSRDGRFRLVPLKDFYFNTSIEIPKGISMGAVESVFTRGNLSAVYTLFVVSILILLIGIFNFANIYTLILLKRDKEFTVKKIHGAGRWHIFRQLYFENFVMTLIALFGAWLFIEITGNLLAERLSFIVQPNKQFNIILSFFVLFILPLVTITIPFIRLSYIQSVTSLRTKNSGSQSSVSRSIFLSLQYIITFVLFVSSLFFIKQLNHMLNSDPGYKTENVIITRLMQRNFNLSLSMGMDYFAMIDDQVALTEQKMNESPLFTEWLFGKPVYNLSATLGVRRVGDSEFQSASLVSLSPDFLKMFDLQLNEGRLWNETDDSGQKICIINETAKKQFNIDDIHNSFIEFEHEVKESDIENSSYKIVGVINDFQTGHLSKPTVPLIITYEEKGFHFEHLMARYADGREEEAIAYLESLYKEINGETEFVYSLLDDEIESLYEDDLRIASVYTLFAIIAILISCLGLFALSLYDIQQRYREISLRKVNGANTKDILRLLLRNYILLLGLSFIIAIPVTILFLNNYLQNFAFKTAISWWLFAIPAVVVAVISLLTVTHQVTKASRINPAEVLKGE